MKQWIAHVDVAYIPPYHRPVTDCPLSTVGDRAFSVTAAHIWNSLPQYVTAAASLSSAAAWWHTSLGAAFLNCNRYSYCCAWGVTPSFLDTLIILVTYL